MEAPEVEPKRLTTATAMAYALSPGVAFRVYPIAYHAAIGRFRALNSGDMIDLGSDHQRARGSHYKKP